ncbi:hypothetical protein AAMO2058_001127700 [Amorphochlora amoebiformis]
MVGECYVVIVMGVSGSGKSSVGEELGKAWRAEFEDGDDWHSKENIEKMRKGTALNDTDRQAWLMALASLAKRNVEAKSRVVIACSALKKKYRDILRGDLKPSSVRFVFLDGTFQTISERLMERKSHFFKPGMLKSQFEALERPCPSETDVSVVPITLDIPTICNYVLKIINASNATVHTTSHRSKL